jgi:hypothetical protein
MIFIRQCQILGHSADQSPSRPVFQIPLSFNQSSKDRRRLSTGTEVSAIVGFQNSLLGGFGGVRCSTVVMIG